ncbi:gamma-glutamyltransferase family protein [Pseudomonas sp. 21LCFQ010]|uniref:gamma-glutamyltransferase family protein n=1 Tax=Pseudomonas sp. 21LCFQ010 TaxID=2957506 RepID=UPI0020969DBD|nr:gamma-glutamyltransferase family protein [Pseudomonas sp. 21LCFQ010]MCO8161157.1 gamma-glutamyltransferase family protein [Pseudomonas sp. 21LCFQ010]
MLNTTLAARGIAVAPHSLAAQSALAILRNGGNAIEAMVAAAATIAVVYPHMNGLGGDGFWLIVPKHGEPLAIDASGPAGSLATLERYRGQASIPLRGAAAALTVAGTVGGWQEALAVSAGLGGSTPLPALLADAIHYASAGIPVTRSQHAATAAKLAQLQDIPGFADTYLCHSEGRYRVPEAGSLFRQPRLAQTLQRLSDCGLDDFYRGSLGDSIAADLQQLGAPVTRADLAAYRAKRVKPLALEHGSGTVYNLPPPTQGVVSQLILGIAEQAGLADAAVDSAAYVHTLVEATKLAFKVRDAYITDPAHMKVDPQAFLAPDFLGEQAALIDPRQAQRWGEDKGPGDTVWMGVIDSDGLAVSFIQSIYHEFGSGVVLSDSGLVWQNRGASFSLDPEHLLALQPGKQPFHTLNPAAARLHDGRSMVYGTMGGDGQPQTQAAVFTRYAVFNQPLQQAVSAPRWLLGRTWGDSSVSLKLESRFDPQRVGQLAALGHDVEVLEAFSETMGHAGAAVQLPNGTFEGAYDPRGNGAAAGF